MTISRFPRRYVTGHPWLNQRSPEHIGLKACILALPGAMLDLVSGIRGTRANNDAATRLTDNGKVEAYFDGTDDQYVFELGTVADIANPFTIVWECQLDSFADAFPIIGHFQTGVFGGPVRVFYSNNSSYDDITVGYSSTNRHGYLSPVPMTGVRHWGVWSYFGGTWTTQANHGVWINGLAATGTTISNIATLTDSTRVGGTSTNTLDFNGGIRQFRLYDRAWDERDLDSFVSDNDNLYSARVSVYFHEAAAATTDISPTTGQATYTGQTPTVTQGFGTVTVAEQTQRVYQRDWSSNDADITISGTYTETATSIEYRLLAHADDSVVVDWATLDASPAAGTFSGTVAIPEGGMYYAEVRKGDAPSVTDGQSTQWGVGDLIGFTGQSNARNCFDVSGTAYGTLQWWWASTTSSHTPTAEWKQLTSGCNGAKAFGDAWIAATGVPVGFFDTGVGSSAAASWQGGATNYEAFEAACDANGSSVAAIVYWQGEAEAAAGGTEAGYEDDLYNDANSVIKQPRIDLTNPTTAAQIPFVLMVLGRSSTISDANVQAIRQAQLDVADTAPGVYRVTIADLDLIDGTHYTQTSYGLACARAAQAALYALGEAAYYRGPQIDFAVLVDSTTVDIYLTHDGGTDISPSSGINGFEVFDDASPVTISSAVRQAANVVRLTLGSAISGTMTARFMYGADGGVTYANAYSGELVDNTSLALPAEHAASIPEGMLVAPTTGAAVYAGETPTIPVVLSPTTGAVAYAGQTPTIGAGTDVAPSEGAVAYAGQTPVVANPQTVSPTSGAVAYSGNVVSILAAIIPTSGAVTYSGGVPSINGGDSGAAAFWSVAQDRRRFEFRRAA